MHHASTIESSSLPLRGVRVVVTRPTHQADGLCDAFAALGATVERLPLLEVAPAKDSGPLHQAVESLADFRWVAFTSANAVAPLTDRLTSLHRPWPETVRVAAVGRATAATLRGAGVPVDLVAEGGGADLAQALRDADPDLATQRPTHRTTQRTAPSTPPHPTPTHPPPGPVLLPQAEDARPELSDALTAAGARPHAVVAYRKRLPPDSLARAASLFPPGHRLGWVTVTSPRIAARLAELLDQIPASEGWVSRRDTLRAASIGPTTTAALLDLGVHPEAEAARPGDSELVRAVLEAASEGHRSRS